MPENARARLIFHGAVVLLVGLLSGLPTVIETGEGPARFWHTAHEALIMVGVWMLAASSVLPALILDRPKAAALVWSLLTLGYGFTVALVIGGVIEASAFEPGGTPATFAAFVAAVIGIFGAVLATVLTLVGALAAIRAGHTG